jgi:dolichol-phosphate mannosyltransferase
MAARDITVVVPVLNEAGNVAPLVGTLHEALAGLDWEVLFVDDDSTDGTCEAVLAIARADPRVRHILRVVNPGLANSCIQGMLSSCADVLCVMDGDAQHDPRIIRELRDRVLEGADVASAARRLAGRDALSGERRQLSRLGNAVVRLVLKRDTRDPLSGFFVIRRNAFLSVVRNLSDSGFKLLFDILVTGPTLRHVEVAHELKPRLSGSSKLDALVMWQFASLVVEKLARGLIPARLVSFLAVGGIGFGVHMAVLYTALALQAPFHIAQGSAALTAATSNFLLNNALTWRERRFRGLELLYGWLAYLAVSSVGLVANVAIATWAYGQLRGLAIVAASAGILMDAIWKFAVADRLVWPYWRKARVAKAALPR